jgi:pSer/pThr/pTyr-binding forkhead associated (FHA) protein/tetratricopeptide (TPR) repeat protein
LNAQITVATADGRSFVRPIDRPEFTLGRDSRNNLVLGDRQVSKFHLKILDRDGECVVQDLGSSNGTLINGIRVKGEIAVSTGDRVRVGPYEIIFAVTEGDAGMAGHGAGGPPTPAVLTARPAESDGADDLPELELALDMDEDLDPLGGGASPAAPPPPPGAPRAVQLTDPTPMHAPRRENPLTDSGIAPTGGRAYLEIIDGDGKGHMITVGNRGVTIGAGSRNHLVLDDPFVSRAHCRVDHEGNRYTVRDMGSTNGIRVDGQDSVESRLIDGTRLQVGGVLMVFRWPDRPEDATAIRDLPPPRARPANAPAEIQTAPGAPVPALQRPGRTTATVREMPAIQVPGGPDTLGPAQTQTARKKPPSDGAVNVGGLRFRKWQLAVIVLLVMFVFLAVLAKGALVLLGSVSEPPPPTTESVFNAAMEAYKAGDWDTAETQLALIPQGDPRYEDAQKYLESIAVEGENADRVDRIGILMKEYKIAQDSGFFQRAYEIYKEVPGNSRYFEDAQALIADTTVVEAQKLRDEAAGQMAAGQLDEASALLDRAAEYEPEHEELTELREILEVDDPRKVKRMMKKRGVEAAEPGDAATADAGTPRAATPRSIQTAGKALETYLGGDVSGARSMLERAIDSSRDAAQKLELQDTLGRIDRIERACSAGQKAMAAGDLDTSLDRFETAYRDITRMDSGGKSERRAFVRRSLAECRYKRGRDAFDRGKYAKANFEWRAGRKADSGHDGIRDGRDELEAVAKDMYNDGYVAEKEGSQRGRDEARRLYERVVAIAPQGEGYQYYDKAQSRLAEL